MDLTKYEHWGWLVLFCLGVYVETFVIRKMAEGFFQKLKTNYIWNEVVLRVMPVFLGILTGIKYPMPESITTWSMRIIMSASGGFCSTFAYQIVKALVKRETGVDVDEVEKKLENAEPAPIPAPVAEPKK